MVYSIAGRDLLGPVHLEPQHSMEHVSRLAAAALGVPHCKLVSQVGLTLASSMTVQACGLDDGDVITAVADMSPFYLILTWLPVINGFIRPAGEYIARAEELFLCRRCGFVAANHMWHQATDSNGPLHRFRCCYCFTAYHPWKKDRRLCLFNKVLVNVTPMDSNKIIATPAWWTQNSEQLFVDLLQQFTLKMQVSSGHMKPVNYNIITKVISEKVAEVAASYSQPIVFEQVDVPGPYSLQVATLSACRGYEHCDISQQKVKGFFFRNHMDVTENLIFKDFDLVCNALASYFLLDDA